jgi:hypothetical protein
MASESMEHALTDEPAVVHPGPSLKLEPLERLRDARVNPRTHDDAQLRQLANSIRRFGWTRPVFYDYAADEKVVGHGATGAARIIYESGELIYLAPGKERGGAALPRGMVPVLDVTGWTPEERRAYLLADNALAEQAGWDYGLLASELRFLDTANFDIGLLGFSPAQLDDILAPQRAATAADPDEVPGLEEIAVTSAGDLWRLGNHRLLCGDATSPKDVATLLEKTKADLCLTDPPYGIGYGYAKHDDRDNDANAQLVAAVFKLAPAAKVWTPGLNNLARDIARFGHAKLVIWHKGFAAAGNGLGGASTIEPVLVLDPPRANLPDNYMRVNTDREQLNGQSLRDLHPCPKPVEMYERLARAFSNRGQIIYEPFGGSGTTLIACERTGRACRAMEIDPAYCDVIVRRWQSVTGREATLGGKTFEQVSAEQTN